MSTEIRRTLIMGSLLAMLAVILGAFGAHGLKARVAVDQLAIFETGVRYQFYHGLAILVVALLMFQLPKARFREVLWFFSIGILLFSGSLYILATRELTGISSTLVGPLTPIGGLFFILGWISLIRRVLQQPSL